MEMSIRFPGLDLVLSYVPRSFQVFGMEFTIYGVLIAIGALLGMGLVTLEAKRSGEDQNKYLDMTIISLLFSVVGSRLFYVAFSWDNHYFGFHTIWSDMQPAYLPNYISKYE